MTICPIAIALSCEKCPVFKVCPAKGIIGDHVEGEVKDVEKAETKDTE